MPRVTALATPATPAPAAAEAARDVGLPLSMQDDPAAVLHRVLQDVGTGEARAKLWRYDASRRMYAYVAMLPFTETFLEDVQAEFGAGQYRATVQRGREYLSSVPPFVVGDKPRGGNAAPDDRLSRLESMLERLLTDRAAPASTGDPFTIALKIAEVAKASAPPAPDPLAAMKLMRESLGMLREMTPETSGAGPDPLASLLTALAPSLVRSLEAGPAPSPGAPVGQPARPAAAVPAASAPAMAAPSPSPLAQLLRSVPAPAWTLVGGAARRRADVAPYVDMLLAELPEPKLQQLAELSAADTFRDDALALLPPPVAEHREWFAEFFDDLRARLQPEPEDSAE